MNQYIEFETKAYRRVATIPAQIVVDLLREGVEVLKLDDDLEVKLTSNRIKTYIKGVTCVHCGLEGKYFAVERQKNDNHYHLNIYAIKNGKEMMITSDHIKAKSKKGEDGVENRQPMCKKCNETKGSFATVEEGLAAREAAALAKYKTMADIEQSLKKRLGNYNHLNRMIRKGDTTENWQTILENTDRAIDNLLFKWFGVRSLTYTK